MLIPPILVLERALRDAGIPIDGVSVGTLADRATWKAFYTAAATDQQKAQGDQILATLDPQDGTILATLKSDRATSDADDDVLKAIVQALWEAIPAPTMTKVQLRARIIALRRLSL